MLTVIFQTERCETLKIEVKIKFHFIFPIVMMDPPFCVRRLPFTKRALSGCNSNGSQVSAASDFLGVDDVDSPTNAHHSRSSERRCNGSADLQGRVQASFRPWATASQSGGMCSDSESAGGSSESRSMDSPTASPGRPQRLLRFEQPLQLSSLKRLCLNMSIQYLIISSTHNAPASRRNDNYPSV